MLQQLVANIFSESACTMPLFMVPFTEQSFLIFYEVQDFGLFLNDFWINHLVFKGLPLPQMVCICTSMLLFSFSFTIKSEIHMDIFLTDAM